MHFKVLVITPSDDIESAMEPFSENLDVAPHQEPCWCEGKANYQPCDTCGGSGIETTTRNPRGEWDYWRIGGRWCHELVVKEPALAIANPELAYEWAEDSLMRTPLVPQPSWPGNDPYQTADQAQKRNIDFEAMGLRKLEKAQATWAKRVTTAEDRWGWELGIKPGTTEREFFADQVRFSSWIVLTAQGEWISQHDYRTDIKHEPQEWARIHGQLVREADDDHWFSIVDIHS